MASFATVIPHGQPGSEPVPGSAWALRLGVSENPEPALLADEDFESTWLPVPSLLASEDFEDVWPTPALLATETFEAAWPALLASESFEAPLLWLGLATETFESPWV